MPNPVDETTTSGTLIERLGLHRPWLAKELQEHKLFYLYASVLYAAEDALNLAFSYFSLGEALNDSLNGQSDAASAHEFHDYEATPEGLAVTIGCTVFLVLFSSLATYYGDSDNKDNLFLYYVVLFWSHVRDMLKAFKWAYKGVRSTLSVILQLSGHQQVLVQILFPIAIVLAVLAALNRVWIRAMKAERKEMMKFNAQLCEQIFERSNALNEKLEKPNEIEALAYLDSFIYVNNDKTNTKELYYVRRIVDEKGKVSAELELFKPGTIDFTKFDNNLQTLRSENLCRRLCLNLVGSDEGHLHFLTQLPIATSWVNESDGSIVLDPSYANSVIFLTNPDLPSDEKFYKVDHAGVARRDIERGAQFERELAEERKKKALIGITSQQIYELIPYDLIKDYKIRSYDEWLVNRNKDEVEYAAQKGTLRARCYLATAFSAIIDGLYFYMGVLFIASFSPHAFIAMLVMSSILFAICFASRMYEEYDFQRKLLLTQTKVKMALCEAECRVLEIQLMRALAQSERGDTPTQLINALHDRLVEYEGLQKELESQIVFTFSSAILEGLKNGLSFQGVISSLMFLIMAILVLSSTSCPPIFVIAILSVAMAGLIACFTQYLVSYQVYINEVRAQQEYDLGLMSETTERVPKTLYLQNTAEGLQYDVIDIEDGVKKSYTILWSDLPADFPKTLPEIIRSKHKWLPIILEHTWQAEYEAAACGGDIALQARSLFRAKSAIDARTIKPPPQFYLVEWCEVFRLLLSGIVKSEKTFGEATHDRAHDHDETWAMLVVSIIFSGIIGAAFAFRALKKMFGPVYDNDQPVIAVPIDDVSFPPPDKPDKSTSNTSKWSLFSLWSSPPPSPEGKDLQFFNPPSFVDIKSKLLNDDSVEIIPDDVVFLSSPNILAYSI